ncbi:hypothetical protein TNCV_2739761 [Trichonephila clavipes]|nr:hypothetical protein TNCV_2739761 [Trichonephila clavipes]
MILVTLSDSYISSVQCRTTADGDIRSNTSRYRVNESMGDAQENCFFFLSTVLHSLSSQSGGGSECKFPPITFQKRAIGERSVKTGDQENICAFSSSR